VVAAVLAPLVPVAIEEARQAVNLDWIRGRVLRLFLVTRFVGELRIDVGHEGDPGSVR
jgi:hypothetical protein